MNRLVLTQTVIVRGHDFRGRPTYVIIRPVTKAGLFWRVDGKDVLVTPHLLQKEYRQLTLQYNGHLMPICENLLALRYYGIDSVAIEMHPKHGLPYDGCAKIFLDAVKPFLRAEGKLEPVALPLASCHYSRESDSVKRSVSALGTEESAGLTLRVFIKYPKIGYGGHEFDLSQFEALASMKTLGWPPRRARTLARVAKLFGWPHYDHILWPQDYKGRPEELRLLITGNRALVFLGALAVATPPGKFFVGVVESVCGGHHHDAVVAEEIWYRLVEEPIRIAELREGHPDLVRD